MAFVPCVKVTFICILVAFIVETYGGVTDPGCGCAGYVDYVCCEGTTYSNQGCAQCDGYTASDCVQNECGQNCNCLTLEIDPYCCDGIDSSNTCYAQCNGFLNPDTQCSKGVCPRTTKGGDVDACALMFCPEYCMDGTCVAEGDKCDGCVPCLGPCCDGCIVQKGATGIECVANSNGCTTTDPCALIDCATGYCVDGQCVQEGDVCKCDIATDLRLCPCVLCADGTTYGCGCGECNYLSDGNGGVYCSNYKPGSCPTTTATPDTTTTDAITTIDPCELEDCARYCVDGQCVEEGDECKCDTATILCRGICINCDDGTNYGCGCGACYYVSDGNGGVDCSNYKSGSCPTTTETPDTTTTTTTDPCELIDCKEGYCFNGECVKEGDECKCDTATDLRKCPCFLCEDGTKYGCGCGECYYLSDGNGGVECSNYKSGSCPTTTEAPDTTTTDATTTIDRCELIDCKEGYCFNGQCVKEGDECKCDTATILCRGICIDCDDGTNYGCGCGACYYVSDGNNGMECSSYKPGSCPTTTATSDTTTTDALPGFCEADSNSLSVVSVRTCHGIFTDECSFADGYICIDDPTDDCDPVNGDVDCIGFCKRWRWKKWELEKKCDFCLCDDGNDEKCEAWIDGLSEDIKTRFLKACYDYIGDCEFDNVALIDSSNIDTCDCSMFYCNSPNCYCPQYVDPYCCKGNDFANFCEARCAGYTLDDCNNNECGKCVCTEEYIPYCCDGNKYGNSCNAKCDGFDVDTECVPLTTDRTTCISTNAALSLFRAIFVGFGFTVSIFLSM